MQGVDGSTVRVQGYTFVFNANVNGYRRRPAGRTRIFGLSQAQLIVKVIHLETNLENLVYVIRKERLVVTDGGKFMLDVNEFGATS